jgi:hypothetical protein
LYQEHKLDEEGFATDLSLQYMQKLPVYCNEVNANKYRARAIFLDTDQAPTDAIRSAKYRRAFSDDNFILGGHWKLGIS